ncbi:MAG: DEAD/DEAH box helicase [Deltaproteobacteria bacterium]|nr:DEAD/DEAH box helicase [Deltaproteobacteria bacterium]
MQPSTFMASTGFDRFGLHETLMRGIRAAGFKTPRPIQLKTIPAGLNGHDVLGLAQTGTGKTAAFALPLLDRLIVGQRCKDPRALILAPTRELANQIADHTRKLSKFNSLKLVTVYGGVSIRNQINELRRFPEIVVGCPGRVLDLIQRDLLRLDSVETLVLDEADLMFDMGFLPGIRKILAALPARRQNLLFSATMPKEIRRLADELLTDPLVVELADTAPAATVDHALYMVAETRKRDLLQHMITSESCKSAIVFTRTKHRARRLAEQLSKAGHRAVGLQGNMSQAQRDRVMRDFRSHRYDILVATDIAARGIDVSDVSHVINYDVPNTPLDYTHRIGRTGRAEREGIACTFVTSGDRAWVRATERMIGAPIPRRQMEGFEPDTDETPERRLLRRGNVSGRVTERTATKSAAQFDCPRASLSNASRRTGRKKCKERIYKYY